MNIIKQETDKSCGVACLRSIFNHYGNDFSEKDIWNKSEVYHIQNGGVANPLVSLGVTALKFGFDVEYIGYNPIIANNNSSEDLRRSLKEKSEKNHDIGKFYVDQTLEFLRLGGKIRIDRLALEKIKKIIDENRFILAEIKPAYIHKECSPMMVHKIIVTGYDKKGFRILDPSDGLEHIWNFDMFLLAFYASSPELLVIKEKGRKNKGRP